MQLPYMPDAEQQKLTFTGERFMPHQTDPLLALEHYHRYLIASCFAKNKRVLDIACGEGYGSAFLAKTAGQVLGIDSDEATVAHAKSKYLSVPNLSFEVGHCENSLEAYGDFDLILGFEMLEHIDEADQAKFLKNVQRILKQDGLFIVSSPEKNEYAAASQVKNQFHKHELTLADLETLLKAHFDHVHLSAQRVLHLSTMWQLEGWQDAQFHFHVRKDLVEGVQRGESFSPPLYLIALCSKLPLAQEVIGNCNSFYFDKHHIEKTKELLQWALQLEAATKQYQEAIQLLQQQLNERAAWVQSLKDEIKDHEDVIARQKLEFDERTTWAKSLAEDLDKHKEHIAKQGMELERERIYSRQMDEVVSSFFYRVLSRLKLLPRIRGR
jgi:2-polyprenyl-3-methyl-5-hydroxy-6-metoxy-1,4-benzoquinol methylase